MHKYSEQKHSENCKYTLTYLDLTLHTIIKCMQHTFNNRISEYILSITHPGSVSINHRVRTPPGNLEYSWIFIWNFSGPGKPGEMMLFFEI